MRRKPAKKNVEVSFGTVTEYIYRKILDYKLAKIKKKKWPTRGKVNLAKLKKIYKEIEKGRAMEYLNDGKVRKLMCIIGESGVGKTLASLHLKNKLGANVICSYTTRPPRETEVEGREHHFISLFPAQSEILADVRIGRHRYYALTCQVWGDLTVYVIDERGLDYIRQHHDGEFDIYTVLIVRDKEKRLVAGVPEERMKRDVKRKKRLKSDVFDYVVENNGMKAQFFEKIENIYNEIKNK